MPFYIQQCLSELFKCRTFIQVNHFSCGIQNRPNLFPDIPCKNIGHIIDGNYMPLDFYRMGSTIHALYTGYFVNVSMLLSKVQVKAKYSYNKYAQA